jgi:hypothetical protein
MLGVDVVNDMGQEMRRLEAGLDDAHRRFRLLVCLWEDKSEAVVPGAFVGHLGRALDQIDAALRIPEDEIVRRHSGRSRYPFPDPTVPWRQKRSALPMPAPASAKKPSKPNTIVGLVEAAILAATREGRWIGSKDILAAVNAARPTPARLNQVSATLSSLAALAVVDRERHPDGFRYRTAGLRVTRENVAPAEEKTDHG